MRDLVRFSLNGGTVEVHAPDPTLTLLDWLRVERRMVGTKEGCAEGDCGACTVMSVDATGAIRQLNACITLLPMVDGCALVTVEGLGGAGAVPRAMIDAHGSQCGFCTPGIVMSLHAHHARGAPTTPEAINDCLAGNLCRCTGYGPIVRAAAIACSEPRPPIPEPPAGADAPLGYISSTQDGPRAFHAPHTLDQLATLCADNPDAIILAGATDIGLWITKQGRRLPALISVMKVEELQGIAHDTGRLILGAAVRYADAMEALTSLHPSLRNYLRRLGAAQVRDSGTVVGNIANGSPIGDMPPVLIALGASIVLRRGDKVRRLPLEQFFLAYGKQDRAPDEIVTHVEIPTLATGALFTAEKISKRFDQDISAVSAGFMVTLENGKVAHARLAYGGMAGIPKRATAAEAALVGQLWNEPSIRAAIASLPQDFAPLTDMRASAAYRLEAAGNLLLRFFRDSQAGPTRLSQLVSVAHG